MIRRTPTLGFGRAARREEHQEHRPLRSPPGEPLGGPMRELRTAALPRLCRAGARTGPWCRMPGGGSGARAPGGRAPHDGAVELSVDDRRAGLRGGSRRDAPAMDPVRGRLASIGGLGPDRTVVGPRRDRRRARSGGLADDARTAHPPASALGDRGEHARRSGPWLGPWIALSAGIVACAAAVATMVRAREPHTPRG